MKKFYAHLVQRGFMTDEVMAQGRTDGRAKRHMMRLALRQGAKKVSPDTVAWKCGLTEYVHVWQKNPN